jgi:hypothetical protein
MSGEMLLGESFSSQSHKISMSGEIRMSGENTNKDQIAY